MDGCLSQSSQEKEKQALLLSSLLEWSLGSARLGKGLIRSWLQKDVDIDASLLEDQELEKQGEEAKGSQEEDTADPSLIPLFDALELASLCLFVRNLFSSFSFLLSLFFLQDDRSDGRLHAT